MLALLEKWAAALPSIVWERRIPRKIVFTMECSQLELMAGTLYGGNAAGALATVKTSIFNVGLEAIDALTLTVTLGRPAAVELRGQTGNASLRIVPSTGREAATHQFVLERLRADDAFAFELVSYAGCHGTSVGANGTALSVEYAPPDRFQRLAKRLYSVRKGLPEPIPIEAARERRTVEPSYEASTATGQRVFVVHGHDHDAKDSVARFLERLGMTAIVLREQPSAGRTVIEKLEACSNVAFAVVLITPDDVGGLSEQTAATQPRARQNVIFELGYFIGKLGRGKVCALLKGNVEIPSNYEGVLSIRMQADSWQPELVRELRAAGLNVDANRMYS